MLYNYVKDKTYTITKNMTKCGHWYYNSIETKCAKHHYFYNKLPNYFSLSIIHPS